MSTCALVYVYHLCCRDIFCAGRVVPDDMQHMVKACGGSVQTSVENLTEDVLGVCEVFEEQQIGGDRYGNGCHGDHVHRNNLNNCPTIL